MQSFVVTLDARGRWHCFCISGGFNSDKYLDGLASDTARGFVESASVSWADDYAVVAYAIHAKSPYWAIKMAREEYKRHQIAPKLSINAEGNSDKYPLTV